MRAFGDYLRDLRIKAGHQTQGFAAKALSVQARKVIHQSFVAQIETGKVRSFTPEFLRIVADAYGEPFHRVFVEYARSYYGVDVDVFTPVKKTLLEKDILDIKGLAAWEERIPASGELWVVTVRLLDYRNADIRNAIIKLIKKRCQIVYFAAEEKDFARLLRQLDASWEEQSEHESGENFADIWPKHLRFVELEDKEIAFMTSSIVISNPREILRAERGNANTEAYLVFGEGLTPGYGLRVNDAEALRDVVSRLRERLKKSVQSQSTNGEEGDE